VALFFRCAWALQRFMIKFRIVRAGGRWFEGNLIFYDLGGISLLCDLFKAVVAFSVPVFCVRRFLPRVEYEFRGASLVCCVRC